MPEIVQVLVGSIVGCWIGAITIGAFIRLTRSKNTNISCAYCGQLVPMATADGGIGAVNVAMQTHISTECEHHPMRALERELAALRRPHWGRVPD